MQFHSDRETKESCQRASWALSRLMRLLKAVSLVLVTCFGSQMLAPAATVTFGWDPVGGAASYRLYQGSSSRNYTQSLASGQTQTTVSNLVEGVTYYFAVTAVGSNSLESAFSDEFSYAPPVPKP